MQNKSSLQTNYLNYKYFSKALKILLLLALPALSIAQPRTRINSDSPVYASLAIDSVRYDWQVQDADLNKPIKGKINVKNLSTNQTIEGLSKEFEANIRLELPINTQYEVNISAEQYKDSTFQIDLTQIESYDVQSLLPLAPKKKPFNISLKDYNTGEEVSSGIVLRNQNQDETLTLNAEDSENGIFKVNLREEDNYELEVKTSNEYVFYTAIINNAGEDSHEVRLIPIQIGSRIPLYGISFESGSSQLNEKSISELNRILDLLLQHPSITLEIAAHTDSDGEAWANKILSQNRAQAVFDFLIKKEIAKQRLVPIGYGEEQPIAPNDTDDNKAKNRRFELLVTGV